MRQSTSFLALALAALYILFLTNPVSAATPTSWCKCTCFKKSLIIPLDAPSSSRPKHRRQDGDDNTEPGEAPVDQNPFKPKTCNDCNKSFCLEQNLPYCKDATEEDVQTSCFQRDSAKDQTVVFVFIIATVSLLAWALAKPFVGKWMDQAKERRSYIPVSNNQDR